MKGCPRCGIDHELGSAECPLRRFGRVLKSTYRLDELLGVGGMGVVYGATHLMLKKKMAVKMPHPQFAANKRLMQRFIREAQAAALVDHPGIVRMTDWDMDEDGCPFLVMERLWGMGVADWLGRGRLPIEQVVRIAVQALDALAAAHACGLIHRNLKPANLFVAREGDGSKRTKILDFGMVQIPAGEQLTETGKIGGTVEYLAPERLGPPDGVRATSDLYSMGATLFHLLTGEPPIIHVSWGDALLQISQGKVRRHPRRIRADVPMWLDTIVAKAMVRLPQKRYQSANEMKLALEEGLRKPSSSGAAYHRRGAAAIVAVAATGLVVLALGSRASIKPKLPAPPPLMEVLVPDPTPPSPTKVLPADISVPSQPKSLAESSRSPGHPEPPVDRPTPPITRQRIRQPKQKIRPKIMAQWHIESTPSGAQVKQISPLEKDLGTTPLTLPAQSCRGEVTVMVTLGGHYGKPVTLRCGSDEEHRINLLEYIPPASMNRGQL